MRTSRFPARIGAALALAGALLTGGALADPLDSEGASSFRQQPQPTRNALSLAELRARLDDSDRQVALQALHIALSQLGDGSAYIWRRSSRQLAGVIKPTMSFRGADGRVCRHLVYGLSLGGYSKSIEGIACRNEDGRWSLSG